MQDLYKEIADKYNLEVKNSVSFKDAYLINTSEGRKILKKSPLPGERILFIHGAKEHLYNNGFKNLDRYLCTIDNNPYIEIDGNNFTITDAIEGNECNFDNRIDIIKASKVLASMHKASNGYIPLVDSRPRDELGKLPKYFIKRLDEIKKMRKVAKRGRSKFDYLFLDYFDYFYKAGENAIKDLSDSKYEEICMQHRQEGRLCHHDYTHHNIICKEDVVSVINFDYCCFELKVYDLANLLRRKMRKCNWDINEAKIIIDGYRSIEKISDEEFYVMKVILQFPQKFWRVINKYYNSKRSWTEKNFVARLQEVIDEVKFHKHFLDGFDKLI